MPVCLLHRVNCFSCFQTMILSLLTPRKNSAPHFALQMPLELASPGVPAGLSTRMENNYGQLRQDQSASSPVDLLLGLFDGRRGTRFSAIMVRHADAVHFGGYDQARHGVLCDTGNWGRIALLYDAVCCIQEPLVQYRVHAASLTQVANCGDWQRYGDNMHEDFLAVLNKSGGMKEAKRLARGFSNHLANITVTVLLRFIRKPGWVSLYVREFWRSRRFMITLFVARRMLRDGWKLLRI